MKSVIFTFVVLVALLIGVSESKPFLFKLLKVPFFLPHFQVHAYPEARPVRYIPVHYAPTPVYYTPAYTVVHPEPVPVFTYTKFYNPLGGVVKIPPSPPHSQPPSPPPKAVVHEAPVPAEEEVTPKYVEPSVVAEHSGSMPLTAISGPKFEQ